MSLTNSSDSAAPFPEPLLPPPPPPPSFDEPEVSWLDADSPVADEEPTLERPRRRIPAEAPPETSFADRYKGTEWGDEPEEPPTAEVPAQRWRPSQRQLLWAGAALLAIAAMAALIMYATALPKTGMGSFTGMTPAPATVATLAPTAPVQPTPSPSIEPPWVTDPRHPAALFRNLMAGAGPAYRLEIQISLDAGGQPAHVSQTADIDGADYSWTEQVTTATQSVAVEAVRKGLYYYTKNDAQPWVRRGAKPAFGVLGNLDSAWGLMQYVGPESVGDRLVHHLRLPVSGWPGAADSMVFQVVAAPAAYALDVWVDDKGRPIRASLDAQLTLRVSGRDTITAVHADYTFSRWGKRPRIDAPDRFNPG
jgi:hypothetical protein